MSTTPIVTAAATEFLRQLGETEGPMNEDQKLDMYWILSEQLSNLKVFAALEPSLSLLAQYRSSNHESC